MSSVKHIKWLYSELPHLVADGIIPPESAAGLRQHYGTPREINKSTILLLLFGILGAVLIGLGIILILAHNWDMLGRPLRTGIGFAPLVTTQIIGLWVVLRKRSSRVWNEAVSTLIMLSLGATIALISQIYQLGGDLDTFLLVWMLLSLPLVYIMNATTPALLYIAGITWWGIYYRTVQSGTPWGFWLLATLLIPHILMISKPDRYTPRSVLVQWVIAIGLALVPLGLFDHSFMDGWPILIYAGLFGIFCMSAVCWDREDVSLLRRPFEVVGTVGAIVLIYILTFWGVWHELAYGYGYAYSHTPQTGMMVHDISLACILIAGSVALAGLAIARGHTRKLFFGFLPIAAATGYFCSLSGESVWGSVILFNVYLLAYSIITIVKGIRRDRLLTVNGGMIILALLILARFFDVEFEFLIKGVIFILIGIGFIVTNIIIVKRRKESIT